ncbi:MULTISPECIES: hypothetical protein [unclassified Isoptericola]|uniref:hypothetical protein n=1 Tax=unclassified Isoptericola TaxID=2623355 RepID=UPI00364B7F99
MTPPSRPFPIASEAAPGLVLRWAGPTVAAPDLDHLAVDLVNAGTEPWAARKDQHLLAVGLLRSAGEERDGFAFALFGSQRFAVPLGPGDYARLPVQIGGGEWSRARPGPTLVDAVLPGIGLGTEAPLSVDLTADDIARRRTAAPARRDPGDLDRAARDQLATMSTLLAARGRLTEVIDAVLSAGSDDDAVARVAALLGCDEERAGLVVRTGIVRYRDAARLEAEVTALRERLADADS